MKNHSHRAPRALRQAGFTMLEMMITLAVLIGVLGVVFSYTGRLQKVYRAEETKVDAAQEARTFIDSIERELHQAGFPGKNNYPSTRFPDATVQNSKFVAAGLVAVTKWDLAFEGDIDADGNVESVRYTLVDNAGNMASGASQCPCTLQRTQIAKVDGTAPMLQITNAAVLASGSPAVQNVINSSDENNVGALSLAGSLSFHAGTSVSNDVFYASYKAAPVFSAFDQNGAKIALPVTLAANAATMRTIRTVVVTLNVLTTLNDMQTNSRPPLSMTAAIKLNNF